MGWFFQPLQSFEEGSGFALWSPPHLVYLLYCALLIASLVMVYRRMSPGNAWGDRRRTMMLAVAVICVGMKLSEIGIMMADGVYNVYWWPLHPCNICEFLLLLYALRPNHPTGEVLYALGLPGAIAGILFADWIKRSPVVNWFCFCGFTEHSLIIAFVLMLLVAGDLVPDLRRIWQPALFVGICVPPIYAFDQHFGTNFWFVNRPSPGSPLVLFADLFGDPGYLIPYLALLLVVWTLMYLPWELARRRRKSPITTA